VLKASIQLVFYANKKSLDIVKGRNYSAVPPKLLIKASSLMISVLNRKELLGFTLSTQKWSCQQAIT